MTSAVEVANYLLSKDPEMKVFAPADDKNLVKISNVKSYAGNVRLNKYLHIAQNLHIAMFGTKLFNDDLYAYVNGGVVPEVQNNYALLRQGILDEGTQAMSTSTAKFLDRFSEIFDYAPLDELIEISHEDAEWREKQLCPHGQQKMDSLSRISEYRDQYEDAIYVFNHPDFGVES